MRAGSTATVATKGSDSLASVALYECGSQSVIILDFSSQNWQDLLDNFFVKCGEGLFSNLFSSNNCYAVLWDLLLLPVGKTVINCDKHCAL